VLYAYVDGAYWDDDIHDRADIFAVPPTAPTSRAHPVDKPVGLLAHLIEPVVPPGGLVLDPFMGGGSTILAARGLGRRAVGIESEERYCEVAANRLRQDVLGLEAA
jgi:DNA modification methylase